MVLSKYFQITLFSLFATLSTYSQISISILDPSEGHVTGGPLRVIASVNSEFQLEKVTAIVEGREASLTFSGGGIGSTGGWGGLVDLVGLPKGELSGIVTAVDLLGNTATSSEFTFIYDEPPVLTVFEPLTDAVATPKIRIRAVCSDDEGDCSIHLRIGGGTFGRALIFGSEIDEEIDFSEFIREEDGEVSLVWWAEDSSNQRGAFHRTPRIHATDSSRLIPVQSAPGRIIDVNSDQILYMLGERDDREDEVLGIFDRKTGQTKIVFNEPLSLIFRAFLTPNGAIFVARLTGPTGESRPVIEFREDVLLNVGESGQSSLLVNGRYAIWINREPTLKTLIRRDLIEGKNIEISTDIDIQNDLSADGAVAFWTTSNDQISLYKNGTSTQLSQSMELLHFNPRTDGKNVVYGRENSGNNELLLHDGTSESVLLPETFWGRYSDHDFVIEEGWVAYRDFGGGQRQIWVTEVGGVSVQRSIFGTSSSIVRLNDRGVLIFNNNNEGPEHLGVKYLSQPSGHFLDLGRFGGETIWLDQRWMVYIGRTLFALNTTDEKLALNVSVEKQEDGNYWLEFERNSDQVLMLQTSDNLLVWSDIREIESTEDEVELGSFEENGISRKFYRLMAK